jgi:DNA-binding NarL/FixJ family response regulator
MRTSANSAWNALPAKKPITVLISRFDDLFLAGLRQLLDRDGSVETVAADIERDRLSVVIAGHSPDVAVIDGEQPGIPAAVRALSADHPRTSLVVLLHDPSDADCAELLGLGAAACLGTSAQARDVLNAIHLASRGLRLTPRASPGAAGPQDGVTLTPRETELLPLLREGRSNAEIALQLQIGIETVRTHTRSIYKKLRVSSRRELIATPRPQPAEPRALPAHRRRRAPTHARRPGHGLRPR